MAKLSKATEAITLMKAVKANINLAVEKERELMEIISTNEFSDAESLILMEETTKMFECLHKGFASLLTEVRND